MPPAAGSAPGAGAPPARQSGGAGGTGGAGKALLGGLVGVVVAAIAVVVLVLTGVLTFGAAKSGASAGAEGNGYATAEEAAIAYVDALRDGDVDGMLDTFAYESVAANCKLKPSLERLGVWQLQTSPCPYPTETEVGAAANRSARRGAVHNLVAQQLAGSVSPTMANDGSIVPLRDESEIDAFLSQV